MEKLDKHENEIFKAIDGMFADIELTIEDRVSILMAFTTANVSTIIGLSNATKEERKKVYGIFNILEKALENINE
jgi:hypothetical protein